MKILIVYGTTEGQTRKIARFMEDVLQDAGADHISALCRLVWQASASHNQK